MYSARDYLRIFRMALVTLLFASRVVASDSSSNLTVKAALIRAVGLSQGHNIFNIYDAQKDGTLLRDRFRDIEIRAERNSDGSVTVAFSRPLSHVMVSVGRKPTIKMLEVIVAPSSSTSKELNLPSDKEEVSKRDEDRLCAAIAIALEQDLKENPVIEVAVGTMMRDNGLTVFIERIPYMPGGHTTYIISEKNEIEEVWPGA